MCCDKCSRHPTFAKNLDASWRCRTKIWFTHGNIKEVSAGFTAAKSYVLHSRPNHVKMLCAIRHPIIKGFTLVGNNVAQVKIALNNIIAQAEQKLPTRQAKACINDPKWSIIDYSLNYYCSNIAWVWLNRSTVLAYETIAKFLPVSEVKIKRGPISRA